MSVALSHLVADLPGARVKGNSEVLVDGVAYDSRRVGAGDLFICIKGFIYNGHHFAGDAVAQGAVALVVERELPLGVPQIIVEDSRRAMGLVAARFYQHPAQDLRVIGVTGTNGKTTTTYLIRSVMAAAGRKCGLVGTIEQSVGEEASVASRTTPESADIQRLLRQMAENQCDACAMEVSSHGLVLHRTAGTEFDVGVFTNITQDHFDFHRNFEDYLEAKMNLFRDLRASERPALKRRKYAVVNGDDPHAARFAQVCPAPVHTYGLGEDNDICAASVRVAADGVEYLAQTPQGSLPVRLRLTGRFNVYNSLAALAVGVHEGIDLQTVAQGLAETVVPGRFEPVDAGQDFAVIVDYAHTPDSLENVLHTARGVTKGRVICVFGAGGDRDRGKRSLMGEVAADLADYVVVTSDNPRSEDPELICDEVGLGLRRRGATPYDIVVDRRQGIRKALGAAEAGDLVLIAGKGHETYQEFKGHTVHFDDREEAAEAIRERGSYGAC